VRSRDTTLERKKEFDVIRAPVAMLRDHFLIFAYSRAYYFLEKK
jgi:hypothetical protein